MIIPVILSGGMGTRLWPLSREVLPKQFLSLTGDVTLFESTVERVQGIPDCDDPLVICNEEHRFLVAEQLRKRDYKASGIILEPVGRNTAPAVACAALYALEWHDDAMLLVMPSDHVIRDNANFQQAVAPAVAAAEMGKLVTFGILAERPETGYGYIRKKQGPDEDRFFTVAEFVEKPDLETARTYIESGNYFWNSGLFMFRATSYLQELEQFAPEMLECCKRAYGSITADLDFLRIDKTVFSSCPGDSIDYAVMEKTQQAVVVPMDAGWNDVGAWSALWDLGEQDEEGNVMIGDVMAEQTSDCYLRAEHRLLSGVGIKNLVVIETADAVMVADKSKVQDVKMIVDRLKASTRSEHQSHIRVYRPWGSYETIDECRRFKVKRIIVKPGESLSLQMHHHRAEHWVVVSGTAKVTHGEEEKILSEDESVYIPLGTSHRLQNPGIIPLEIIEVQTGSYLGEDDIVRFSDSYGRSGEKKTDC